MEKFLNFFVLYVKLWVRLLLYYLILLAIVFLFRQIMPDSTFLKNIFNQSVVSLFFVSLFLCLIDTFQHIEKTIEIPFQDKQSALANVEQTLKRMNWSIRTENENQIIFKAPILYIIRFIITVKIVKNKITLTGPNNYVSRVFDKMV